MESRKTVSTTDTRGVVIYTSIEYAPGIPVTICVDFYGERPVVQWPPKTTSNPRAALDFAQALALAARVAHHWAREPDLPAESVVALAEAEPRRARSARQRLAPAA
ncbi:MAG: hypothetical protein ABFS46_11130 [Myxococcota bacterium]